MVLKVFLTEKFLETIRIKLLYTCSLCRSSPSLSHPMGAQLKSPRVVSGTAELAHTVLGTHVTPPLWQNPIHKSMLNQLNHQKTCFFFTSRQTWNKLQWLKLLNWFHLWRLFHVKLHKYSLYPEGRKGAPPCHGIPAMPWQTFGRIWTQLELLWLFSRTYGKSSKKRTTNGTTMVND